MSTSTTYAQASIYQEVGRRSAIEGASPHRLVEMLLEGAMINIERAVTAIQDNDIEARGKWINKTIDIVAELRNSLDIERGGEIAENLHRLYSSLPPDPGFDANAGGCPHSNRGHGQRGRTRYCWILSR